MELEHTFLKGDDVKHLLVGFVLCMGLIVKAENPNSIRMGGDFIWKYGTPEGICDYLKSNGFNYVCVEFSVPPNGRPNEADTTYMKIWFNAAGAHGIRVIPYYGLVSGSDHSWGTTRFTNWGIQNNWYQNPLYPYWAPEMLGTPEFASNPAGGMDSAFSKLLTGLQTAHAHATQYVNKNGTKIPIEYIHIAHDEFAFGWPEAISIGGQQPSGHAGETFAQVDRTYIDNELANGSTLDLAIQKLICNEVNRKFKLVLKHFPSTKVLIWGDAFDPQHNGGIPLMTYKGQKKTLCPNILT